MNAPAQTSIRALDRIDVWGPFDTGTLYGALAPSIIERELRRRGALGALRFSAPIGESGSGLVAAVPVMPFSSRDDRWKVVTAPGLRAEWLRAMLAADEAVGVESVTSVRFPPHVVEMAEDLPPAWILAAIGGVFTEREATIRRAELVLRGELPDGGPAPIVVVIGANSPSASSALAAAVARRVHASPAPVIVVVDGADDVPAAQELLRLFNDVHDVPAAVLTTGDPFDVVALIAGSEAVIALTPGAAVLAAAIGRPHCACGDVTDLVAPDALVDDVDQLDGALERTADPGRWSGALVAAERRVADMFDAVVAAVDPADTDVDLADRPEGAQPVSERAEIVMTVDEFDAVIARERRRADRERRRWMARVDRLEAEVAHTEGALREAGRLRVEVERMRTGLIEIQAQLPTPPDESIDSPNAPSPSAASARISAARVRRFGGRVLRRLGR